MVEDVVVEVDVVHAPQAEVVVEQTPELSRFMLVEIHYLGGLYIPSDDFTSTNLQPLGEPDSLTKRALSDVAQNPEEPSSCNDPSLPIEYLVGDEGSSGLFSKTK